jgi:alpha-glucosidase
MKVILDGVFNHCGSFNKWMDRERIYEGFSGYQPGAYISENSPYHSFFHFLEGGSWPYNNRYDGWWGHETLPKLNYEESQELETYIINVGRKWVLPPYNIDGWRLDVAADLGYSHEYNHSFWRKFRQAIKAINPEALILAEHYGDPESWLGGDEWDTVMNYDAFMEPVTWFLTGMEKHSDEFIPEQLGNGASFEGAMRHHMANMSMSSLLTAMNELSNHDHSRFLTRTNHVVGRVSDLGSHRAEEDVRLEVMREAVLIQMTWPGAPTVYYGDEAGLCGFTDPDNRRTYPWGREDQDMIRYHRDMIRMHREHQVLKTGSLIFLRTGSELLAYARFDEEESIIVLVNHDSEMQTIEIPVWLADINNYTKLRRLVYTYDDGYTMEDDYYEVINGTVVLNMGPYSAIAMTTKLEP